MGLGRKYDELGAGKYTGKWVSMRRYYCYDGLNGCRSTHTHTALRMDDYIRRQKCVGDICSVVRYFPGIKFVVVLLSSCMDG